MNRGGMSAIVATVLIVLISVVAIGVIWIGIIPMINEDINFDKSARLEIVTTDGYTFYDEDNHLVSVQVRQVGGENVDKVKFILEFSGVSYDFIDVSPGVGQTKVYLYNISYYRPGLSAVKVAPIFNMNGKDVEGDVTSAASFLVGDVDPEDYVDLKYFNCLNDTIEECGSGICFGSRVCEAGYWGECIPEAVLTETCDDRVDNDCDDYVDCDDIDCFGDVFCSVDLSSWNQTFDNGGREIAYSVQQTSDGGYIFAGLSDNDLWLVKTDSEGSHEWNQTFDNGGREIAYSVQQTFDDEGLPDGYILAGSSSSGMWLVKVDSGGVHEWNNTFGSVSSIAYSVQQTDDLGYILTGSSNNDIILVKTDSEGNTDWIETFGGPDSDIAYSVQQTFDDEGLPSGYILAGKFSYSSRNTEDAWLIKRDVDGNAEWNRKIGSGGHSGIYTSKSVQQTSDGGYILTINNFFNIWLVKTDSEGIEEWRSIFDDIDRYSANSVQQTSDGEYIVAGVSESDILLIRTDSDGNLDLINTFDNGSGEIAYSVQQTSDGGYILVGATGSDVWLVKTD